MYTTSHLNIITANPTFGVHAVYLWVGGDNIELQRA